MPEHVESQQRVTPLELFFDLVFVFALTQVTSLMAADPTWGGLAKGLLVLAAVWWAWAAYAWLTNTLDPEEGSVRLTMLSAMAAMLLVALAVPDAFGDDALLFGIAYLLVRVLHIALYVAGTRRDADVLGAVRRMTPTATAGPALLLAAAAFDGVGQAALWVFALAIDYLGVLVGRAQGWRVSPGHFAERHGLVVIIALGESIVAIGAAGLDLDAGVIAAAVLGIAVAAALWWAYFDVVAIVAERKLTEAEGAVRAALARDSYSYLHLPIVAGIVLFALGLKKTIGHVDEPLELVPALGLCGGVALYLLAHVAFRLRNVGTVSRRRLVAAVALVGLIPAAVSVTALTALALTTAIVVALIAYEALRFREARARVRRPQASAV
ncbi:MAG: low temperature requirement protein A [Actinomycetota bacterium]|nr:low temperature requirement protein A [Actinomycetota bacterium]